MTKQPETLDPISPTEYQSRPRADRINDIFKLITSTSPVDTQEKAFALVDESFKAIEKEEGGERMSIGSFDEILTYRSEGKIIHYNWYYGHILFVGENGSIEIREKEKNFDNDAFSEDPEYINQFNVVLKKKGADGKDVWPDQNRDQDKM